MKITAQADLDALDFAKLDGLIPVVAQHARSGEVLMLAFADRDALARTLAEQRMWYWSRSREKLWRKGESSGHEQRLIALFADCDRDSVLALVEPAGPSCHTGAPTCFGGLPVLPALADIIARRREAAPPDSWTGRLFADENLRLKKLAEEALELALACRAQDRDRTAAEAADLLYHALVACAAVGVRAVDVLDVLAGRLEAAG